MIRHVRGLTSHTSMNEHRSSDHRTDDVSSHGPSMGAPCAETRVVRFLHEGPGPHAIACNRNSSMPPACRRATPRVRPTAPMSSTQRRSVLLTQRWHRRHGRPRPQGAPGSWHPAQRSASHALHFEQSLHASADASSSPFVVARQPAPLHPCPCWWRVARRAATAAAAWCAQRLRPQPSASPVLTARRHATTTVLRREAGAIHAAAPRAAAAVRSRPLVRRLTPHQKSSLR